MSIAVLLNRRAGNHSRFGRNTVKELAALLEDRLPGHQLHCPDSQEEMEALARRLASDTETKRIIVAGGDGTFNLVARHFVHSAKPLAVLPLGSGNGIARECGMPRDLRSGIARLAEGRTRRIDAASIEGHAFFVTCGVGFDAKVAGLFVNTPLRGLAGYSLACLRAWTQFSPPELRIRIGETDLYSGHAWLASVANCRQFGNNATIAPKARIDDNLLDLTLMPKPSLTAVPGLLRRLFRARIDEDRLVYCRTAPSFIIESDEAMDAHVDGEHISLGNTAMVKLDGTLTLWC